MLIEIYIFENLVEVLLSLLRQRCTILIKNVYASTLQSHIPKKGNMNQKKEGEGWRERLMLRK